MTNSYTIYVAIAALIGAWVSAAFTFFSIQNQRHSKISDFRQSWINELRNEIASFVSELQKCVFLQKKRDRLRDRNEEELRKELDEAFFSTYGLLVHHKAQIRLRLNRDDSNDRLKKLNQYLLDYVSNAVECIDNREFDKCEKLIEKVEFTSTKVLKSEWERVKQGEKGNQITTKVGTTILLVGLFGLLVVLFFAAQN
ncbi:hypothetical protein [Vibrio metschnikovii]|uniref:hypothetical protein n=1 Tax=Vibrio metschnikovii TaxID=28172 RepID=UPI002FC7D98C